MIPVSRSWHFLIIAFCVWHMFAVAAYLLPASDENALGAVRRISVPYVFALSQWQQWDIFSPNPLRRNSIYRIERYEEGTWETAMIIDFHSLTWHERAKELKILGRLQDDWKILLPNYLTSLCPDIPNAHGKDIRLLVQTIILPSDLSALKQTITTKRDPTDKVLASVQCPQY